MLLFSSSPPILVEHSSRLCFLQLKVTPLLARSSIYPFSVFLPRVHPGYPSFSSLLATSMPSDPSRKQGAVRHNQLSSAFLHQLSGGLAASFSLQQSRHSQVGSWQTWVSINWGRGAPRSGSVTQVQCQMRLSETPFTICFINATVLGPVLRMNMTRTCGA